MSCDSFNKFLSTSTNELKNVSKILIKTQIKKKKKRVLLKGSREKLTKIVKSMNGKLIVCNDSIVLFEVPKLDGTVEQFIFKSL
jgi:hypothetical protein